MERGSLFGENEQNGHAAHGFAGMKKQVKKGKNYEHVRQVNLVAVSAHPYKRA